MNAPLNDPARRHLLRNGLGLAGAALLATPLARAAAAPTGAQVSFLSREAAADALAREEAHLRAGGRGGGEIGRAHV